MITGYCITTAGEAKRYLRDTLDCLQKLCDEVVIVLNRAGTDEILLVEEYGFETIVDDSEWGKNQDKIKERLMKHLSGKKRDLMVCLDSDEVLLISKKELTELKGDAWYVYVMNMWGDGWKRKWSFWNIRVWRWNNLIEFQHTPLHCGLAPKWCYEVGHYVPIILEHYGLMLKEDRLKKVARYEKYDPTAKYKDCSYYEGLKDETFDHINYEHIYQALHKEVGKYKEKKLTIKKPMKYIFLRNKHGNVVDVPENQLAETLARGGFTIVGEVNKGKVAEVPAVEARLETIERKEVKLDPPVVEAPVVAPVDPVGVPKSPLDCEICGFTAKSKAGLKIHSKRHVKA
jgi:hypothetical protein